MNNIHETILTVDLEKLAKKFFYLKNLLGQKQKLLELLKLLDTDMET